MPYTITASDGGKALTATRVRPASASVLARRWADEGFVDVRIRWDDRSFDLDGFQKQFVWTRVGMRPRFPITG